MAPGASHDRHVNDTTPRRHLCMSGRDVACRPVAKFFGSVAELEMALLNGSVGYLRATRMAGTP
jgi:hypothetical protein